MLESGRISDGDLRLEPFRWAKIDLLFAPADARELVASFPTDHFKPVKGYDGEKGYEYESRSLVHMGAAEASNAERLSPSWRRLTADLLSSEYRAAVARLTGVDLGGLPMEANVFHYGPNAWLGPHVDLPDKRVTHVLYFNEAWPSDDGGCLTILRSADMADVETSIAPLVGTSAVLVRSERSWHAVSRVRNGCRTSRRSVVVTFYSPGSVSTMWPPGDRTQLRDHDDGCSGLVRWVRRGWKALRR